MQSPESGFESINQVFTVQYRYPVHFTQGVFQSNNKILVDSLTSEFPPVKTLVIIDSGVHQAHPDLVENIHKYFQTYSNHIHLAADPLLIPGGETSKNDPQYYKQVVGLIHQQALDRHSYILAVGGGAVLDTVGYSAAIAHRGIRLVRLPTTVLAQNDSGVGVKNGINSFGKKNFTGTFAAPWTVINDFNFLSTLSTRDRRSGLAEAVKVGLIKDASFFHWIEENSSALGDTQKAHLPQLIYRCAQLHLQHIASGDPFEQGSSRPLDFGHWSAHKLEQLSNFTVRHGEAVAMGLALDSVYSHLSNRLSESELRSILGLLKELGFMLYHELLAHPDLLNGLDEFREHLGGKLTIMLLEGIGHGVEVHHMEKSIVSDSINWLKSNSG